MSEIDPAQMLENIKAQMDADPAGTQDSRISPEKLAEAMAHPKAAEEIQRVMVIEANSVAEGEPAPEFSLARLNAAPDADTGPVTLSDHFGRRPVALIFGSYT